MLPQAYWRQIEGAILDEKVRVGELLRAEREGLFAAEPINASDFGGAPSLTVRLMRATPEPVLDRYLEASFLNHPGLLRCFGAGTVEFSGTQFVYAILERAETTLADVQSERPLTVDEARELGRQLIEALSYLHQQDLIYCNLDPSTVVRSGERWKLSEYSQLRLAGRGYSGETRRMLAVSAGTPPEAWDGIVSPAWDVWGLAWLLAGAVSERKPNPREGRGSARRPLPEPFATIISECLNAVPSERCRLTRVAELLGPAASETAVPSTTAAARREDEDDDVQPPRRWLRALTPKQALRTAIAFVAGFLVVALLTYHPNRSSGAATIANPQPSVSPAPPPPGSHPNGEADRALDSNTPNGLLVRWANAIRTRNVDQQVACYAPTVFAFYGSGPVTPASIRERRSRAMSRFSTVRRLDISDVDIQMKGPGTAVATFTERWDFAGRDPSSGKVQERLGLRKIDGKWRITSESNVKTFYKNGPNPQS